MVIIHYWQNVLPNTGWYLATRLQVINKEFEIATEGIIVQSTSYSALAEVNSYVLTSTWPKMK